MKKIIPAISIGFLLCFILGAYMDTTEAALSQGLIRLHVVANSDEASDQALKIKVRDRILKECESLSDLENLDMVKVDLCQNLDYINEIAKDEIQKNGYDYDVISTYELCEFPQKKYGNITLPAGPYQALNIKIGKAEGKNWWCVLFPPLCFVDEACVSVSDESNTFLKNQLGDDVYQMVTDDSMGVEFKLKSYEIWNSGKNKLKKYMANLSR